MSYAIEDGDSGWFVHIEIDSGGMSMCLVPKSGAEIWKDKDRAQWFIDNILSERKDKRPYRVVKL